MIDFKLLRKSIIILGVISLISCEEIALSEDISEESITVLAPLDGAEVNSIEVNFNWESLDGAASYKLQVAEPNFEEANQIVLDTITSNISFSLNLTEGIYQWRIRGMNNSYETLYSVQDFTVIEE
jgi:hypothetical protein